MLVNSTGKRAAELMELTQPSSDSSLFFVYKPTA